MSMQQNTGVDNLATCLQRRAAKIKGFCNMQYSALLLQRAELGPHGSHKDQIVVHLYWTNQSHSPSVCLITVERWQGMRGRLHALFSDRNTEAQNQVWTKEKKNPNDLPRGCPKSRTILQGSHSLPHFCINHPQPAAFALFYFYF